LSPELSIFNIVTRVAARFGRLGSNICFWGPGVFKYLLLTNMSFILYFYGIFYY